jgi:AraC family transcriptional regulator of adaptative response/methylated-DNA-[protein]-cysteine methyltransferase
MTPATYRDGASGMHIGYATARCPFGWMLVAATERGLCWVSLGDSEEDVQHALAREYPNAEAIRRDRKLAGMVRQVLSLLTPRAPRPALPLDIRATAFQRLVWDALRHVPPGGTVSYAELARRIGRPRAVRAVARAVACNPVALVIPCHRVIRSDGAIGGYRWGVERKRRLLAMERAGAGRIGLPATGLEF